MPYRTADQPSEPRAYFQHHTRILFFDALQGVQVCMSSWDDDQYPHVLCTMNNGESIRFDLWHPRSVAKEDTYTGQDEANSTHEATVFMMRIANAKQEWCEHLALLGRSVE